MSQQRTEFGFTRTTCSCATCADNCRHMPGFLLPADIPRIARHLGYVDVVEFARDCLLASPGALVQKDDQQFRIPTLVPRRGNDGACGFLKVNLCTIHPVAPYACAFFDEHEPANLADLKSIAGLSEIIHAWSSNSLYTRLWRLLDTEDKRAVPPEIARGQMRRAHDKQAA